MAWIILFAHIYKQMHIFDKDEKMWQCLRGQLTQINTFMNTNMT